MGEKHDIIQTSDVQVPTVWAHLDASIKSVADAMPSAKLWLALLEQAEKNPKDKNPSRTARRALKRITAAVAFIGREFDYLVVVDVPPFRKGSPRWCICKCVCGDLKRIRIDHLVDGSTRSCGCYKTTLLSTHGQSARYKNHGGGTYGIWHNMKSRCLNPNTKSYVRYGARGITVCQRWLDSFENFYADMGERPDGMTLERKDNSKGYSPDNCKWASVAEQTRNTRQNIFLTYNGRTQTLTDWASEVGIGMGTLWSRLNILGWTLEQALNSKLLVNQYSRR